MSDVKNKTTKPLKYNININQKGIIDSGLDIDIIDAIIFDYIYNFMCSGKCEQHIIDNKVYYWISYQKIIDGLPILRIQNKEVIARHVKNLIENKIFDKTVSKEDGNKTLFAIGQNLYNLIFSDEVSTEKSTPIDQTVDTYRLKSRKLSTEKSTPIDSKVESYRLKSRKLSTEKSNNSYINSNINNINICEDEKTKEIADSNESSCNPSDYRPSDMLTFDNMFKKKCDDTDLNLNTDYTLIEANRNSQNNTNDKNSNEDKNIALFNDIDLSAPFGKPNPTIPANNLDEPTSKSAKKEKQKKVKPQKKPTYYAKGEFTWQEIIKTFEFEYERYTKNDWLISPKELNHLKSLVNHFENWIKYNLPDNIGLSSFDSWISQIIEDYLARNKKGFLPTAAVIDSQIHHYLPPSTKRDKPIEWKTEDDDEDEDEKEKEKANV